MINSGRNKIFLISEQPERVSVAESFLVRRGWAVEVRSNFRESLTYIVDSKPDFVFLSIHLDSGNLAIYRNLLARFPFITTILFSENSSMESIQRLGTYGAKHVLYPPIGGPSFDRCIRKILLETPGFPADKPESLDDSESEVYWPYGSNPRIRVNNPSKSQMFNALTSAINNLTKDTTALKLEPIGVVSTLSCVEIRSRAFQGYLVAAQSSGGPVDYDLVNQVYTELNQKLSARGEALDDSDVYVTNVEPVHFKEWCDARAEFLKTRMHLGQEVAFAFFAVERFPVSSKTGKGHMLALDVEAIDDTHPALFDLYLYLPMNERFIRYLRKGDTLPNRQREKLADKDIRRLYFKRADIGRWRTHAAKLFFNKSILNYITGSRSSLTA